MTTSVYIHIPFCNHICTYCDFCKRYTNDELINNYLDALFEEIKEKYQKEKLKTLYIGGGTPSSLNITLLDKLLSITKVFKKDHDCEFTIEVNPESITEEKLKLFKKYGINRISIGIESTQDKFLKYLGRHHNFTLVEEKIALIKKYFDNINVDLIYALKDETINDLKQDLDNIIKLDINHISTYSLEIHDNTILGINKEVSIQQELDSDMYYFICNYLKKKGFNHYEISNFSQNNKCSHHNLVYWHNEKYYGFGMGASGYINNIRYTNTRSLFNYMQKKRIVYQEEITLKDKISYELILGFRLINGINKDNFKKKYGIDLIEQYNIKKLIRDGLLVDDGTNIKVSYDKLYIENVILENFV